MFIVKREEVMSEIKKINEYLSKCTWMDFTVAQSNFGYIELYGAIDQSHNNYVDNYEIKLTFEQPYFISSLFSCSLDASKPFIELCSDEDEINTKYNMEEGHYTFKFNIESFRELPIFIVAKNIVCKILNENPFK